MPFRCQTLDAPELPAAEAHGATIHPLHEVQTISPSPLPNHRYAVTYTVLDPGNYTCTSNTGTIHAKVVVLAAGAVGTPVILQRSAVLLGGIPAAVGRYFSGNGDRVSVADINESKVRTLLGLSRPDGVPYQGLPIGRPITAATYDYLDAEAPEYSRFTLQQIYFPPSPTPWLKPPTRPTGSASRPAPCAPAGSPG